MAEKEQAHRIGIEERESRLDARVETTGVWLGFASLVVLVVAALASVYLRANPWVSGTFLSIVALSIVRAFLTRRPRNGSAMPEEKTGKK